MGLAQSRMLAGQDCFGMGWERRMEQQQTKMSEFDGQEGLRELCNDEREDIWGRLIHQSHSLRRSYGATVWRYLKRSLRIGSKVSGENWSNLENTVLMVEKKSAYRVAQTDDYVKHIFRDHN